jgi:acyl-coenzyme A thioesterase 9
MLDTYANSSGQIRLGTLLMDLDALSGVVAYKHTGEGVTTVTAAVDRITIKNPLKEICDLQLSGQVTFATGRSSMEISLQIAKAPSSDAEMVKEEDVFMTCAFTMVSLDPATKKPVNVAPLKLENDAERQLYARGEENYKNKKAMKLSTITQRAPDAEEAALLHKIWTDSLAYNDSSNPAQKPQNVTYMGAATIYSAQIMQPQYRNRHNFMIFGGYLLKQTFELAFTCAAAFSHTKPSFLNLDPSTFENPVPVGSVLYQSAGVTFTEPDINGGTRIQVIVTTKVRNVEHIERKSTGTFFYTFHVDHDVQIMPQTYSEFMRWVDGRRRAQRVTASLKANEEAGNTHDTIGTASTERVTE